MKYKIKKQKKKPSYFIKEPYGLPFELTEKGTLNIYFSGCEQNENNKLYIGSSSTELEKLELIVELKDKEIAMQQRENENLKVQIAQLQRINALLEKN